MKYAKNTAYSQHRAGSLTAAHFRASGLLKYLCGRCNFVVDVSRHCRSPFQHHPHLLRSCPSFVSDAPHLDDRCRFGDHSSGPQVDLGQDAGPTPANTELDRCTLNSLGRVARRTHSSLNKSESSIHRKGKDAISRRPAVQSAASDDLKHAPSSQSTDGSGCDLTVHSHRRARSSSDARATPFRCVSR